jgi:hypothetical protein
VTNPLQPARGTKRGTATPTQQAQALLAAQAAQAAEPQSRPRHGLTQEEVQDLCNALDVLCSCYADGVNSSAVKRLLKDYAPGTKRGTRARRLFNVLPHLVDRLIDENPDCPRWASQAVDQVTATSEFIADQHQELDDLEATF